MAKKKTVKKDPLKVKNEELSDSYNKLKAEYFNMKENEKKHNDFIKTLITILEKGQAVENRGIFYRSFDEPKRDSYQDIISRVIELKQEFAREDEGTKCQAEQISNLTELLHISMGDPVRGLKIQNETQLIREGFTKHFTGQSAEHYSWVKESRCN